MTERLSILLREETTDLTVPVPDTTAILRQGRAVRRRRRTGSTLATVAAAAVVVVGFAAIGPHDAGRDRGEAPPAAERAAGDDGAFAAGSTVWPRGATHPSVQVDGQVKAVYYTSEGVVAKVGDSPYSDDHGPSRWFVINGDEPARDLGLGLGDRVPGTDPGQPYLAYAEKTPSPGDLWDVVLVDVRDGHEVARVSIGGSFTFADWAAPPVALSGDQVYVSLDRTALEVSWRTGDVRETTALTPTGLPIVSGGRTVVHDGGPGYRVLDVRTGETLMTVPGKRMPYVTLSPDGRYAKLVLQDSAESESSFTVYDLETGAERTVDEVPWDYGWTADGDLLKVAGGEATVCEPFDERACSSEPVDLGQASDDVRLAGELYEA